MYPEKFLAKVEREVIPPFDEAEGVVTIEDLELIENLLNKEELKFNRLGGDKTLKILKREKMLVLIKYKKTEEGYEYILHNETLFKLKCDEETLVSFLKNKENRIGGDNLYETIKNRNRDYVEKGLDPSEIRIISNIEFIFDDEVLRPSEYIGNLYVLTLENTIIADTVNISGSVKSEKDENIIEVLMPLNTPLTFLIFAHELGHALVRSVYFKKEIDNAYGKHRQRAFGDNIIAKDALAVLEDERLAHQYGKNLTRKMFSTLLFENEMQLFESYALLTYLNDLRDGLKVRHKAQNKVIGAN